MYIHFSVFLSTLGGVVSVLGELIRICGRLPHADRSVSNLSWKFGSGESPNWGTNPIFHYWSMMIEIIYSPDNFRNEKYS